MTTAVATFTSLDDAVKAFATAMSGAESSLISAGKIYADAIDQHGQDARERFTAACPKIGPASWRRIEAIGRECLDSRLWTASGVAAAPLRKIPFHAQVRALDNGVEVLIGSGDTLLVNVDNLTRDQVKQVFASDHIRDVAEQRAWMETNDPSVVRPKNIEHPAYQVRGWKVLVSRPCALTRLDLVRLLGELG